jgi:hypothetical protein
MIRIIKGSIFSMAILLIDNAAFAYKRISVYSHNQAAISQMKSTENICTPYLNHIERKYSIPNQLLAAIAQVESGRWNKKSKKHEPWPWAVHAEGKGHFFASKAEAIQAVRGMLNRGVTNIDVGCMQINIGHHGHAFQTLAHMFDPGHNIAYAGKFLKSLKGNSSSWSHAVAHYHSATPSHHVPYRKKVYKAWAKARHENVVGIHDERLFEINGAMDDDLQQSRFVQAKPCPTKLGIGDEIGATSYQIPSLRSKGNPPSLKSESKASRNGYYGLVGARRLTSPNKYDRARPMHVAYGKRVISRPIMLGKSTARGKKYLVPQGVRSSQNQMLAQAK